MGSGLGSSHSQFVVLVFHFVGLGVQFVARVVSVCAERLAVLGVEVASLRRVRLSGQTPDGSLRHGGGLFKVFVDNLCVHGLPVGGLVSESLFTSSFQRTIDGLLDGAASFAGFEASTASVLEQLRLVRKFVAN